MCLLLFSRDSEQIVNDLMIRFGETLLKPVCVDDLPPKITDEHVPQNELTNALHITVFSRGFLGFLERKPGDAFAVFKQLDPKKTVAVFCGGLRAEEVTSCHTAPLRSFNLWGKFFVNLDKNNVSFPEDLLQKIEDVVPKSKTNRMDLVLVPHLVNQENSFVYVILPNILRDSGTAMAQIEQEDKHKTIKMKKINPYVLEFSIPDEFLMVSHGTVDVTIRHRNMAVYSKKLQVVSDCCSAKLRPRIARNSRKLKSQSVPEECGVGGRRESTLGENLQALCDIVVRAEDEDELDQAEMEAKRQVEEIEKRLKNLCWKLALEEMNTILQAEEIPEQNDFRNSRGDTDLEIQVHGASSDEGTDETDDQSSCSSLYPLPQECEQGDNSENGENPETFNVSEMSPQRPTWLDIQPTYTTSEDAIQYICMNKLHKQEAVKPHEHILQNPSLDVEQDEDTSVTQILYTAMTTPFPPLGSQGHSFHRYLEDEDASYSEYKHSFPSMINHTYCNLESMKSLSRSQQNLLDLMHAFKEGTITMSMMERHIRLWRQKHSEEPQGRSALDHWKRVTALKSRMASDEISPQLQGSLRSDQCPIYPDVQPPPLPARPPLLSKPPPRGRRTPDFRINMLLELCERYGMEILAEQFLIDIFCGAEKRKNNGLETHHMRFTNQDYRNEVVSRMEADSSKNVETAEVDNSYHRSMSVPYYQVKTVKTHEENEERPTEKIRCMIRPGRDGIYQSDEETSPSPIIGPGYKLPPKVTPEDASENVCLSNSQKELMEIMAAFKRGEKTMSQAEQLYDSWKKRYTDARSEARELNLKSLQIEYKNRKAAFKYFPIIKSKKKHSKQMDNESEKVKIVQNSEQLDTISKTLCKISSITEANDALKNVGSNVKECLKRRKKSRGQDKFSPPPTPEAPRVPAPNRYNPEASRGRKNRLSDSSVPKPDPPPKPKHLLRTIGITFEENIAAEHSEEDNEVQRPHSPDYITPDKPARTRRKISRARSRNSSAASSKDTSPAPQTVEPRRRHGERKISKQKDHIKKENKKVDKKEESMFYISPKKWSSASDVRDGKPPNIPVYLELLNSKRNAQPLKESDKESDEESS